MTFPIWKTVQIGVMSDYELEQELCAHGCSNLDADRYRRDYSVAALPEPKEVDLVLLRVDEMGLDDEQLEYPDTSCIWQRARDLGLALCPTQTGPYLRMHQEIPNGEKIWVAVDYISDAWGLWAFEMNDNLRHKQMVLRCFASFKVNSTYHTNESYWWRSNRIAFSLDRE